MFKLFPVVFLLACAQEPVPEPINFSFTLTNNSGYDFTYIDVCFDDGVSYDCSVGEDGVPNGVFVTGETALSGIYGATLKVDASAIDTDLDGYVWGPQDYTLGPSVGVTILFTEDNCCYDF